MVMGEEKCYKGLPFSEAAPFSISPLPPILGGRSGNQTIP